jgi:AhpD family alkylhydroperoxidase
MSKRLEVFKLAPQAYKGFGMVKDYVKSALPAELLELVYLRISQINGCAYCIDMHTRDLLAQGVKVDKVALVPVWDEAAALFSDSERAALAWAETVTRVEQTRVPDADYQRALAVLGEQALADLTVAVALMNAFNRFGVGLRMQPAALD